MSGKLDSWLPAGRQGRKKRKQRLLCGERWRVKCSVMFNSGPSLGVSVSLSHHRREELSGTVWLSPFLTSKFWQGNPGRDPLRDLRGVPTCAPKLYRSPIAPWAPFLFSCYEALWVKGDLPPRSDTDGPGDVSVYTYLSVEPDAARGPLAQ